MSKKIGPNDRLGMTLMLAGSLHAALLLGVTFTANDPAAAEDLSTLDVALVQTRSSEAPEKADFLGQANQLGGGESDEKAAPGDVFSSQVPKPDEGIAPVPITAQALAPQTESAPADDVIVLNQSERDIPSQVRRDKVDDNPLPKADQAIERDMEMARLQASINNTERTIAKRPRRKFLTANSIESVYAEYIQAWGAKVERVGNINYPELAREQNLRGSVIMTVSIRRDGSIEKIRITQGSGSKILDDAAVRSVELSAPFSEFPDDPKERVDILDLTRTFQFLPGNQMRTD